jgi:group I intron endonuclease
MRIFKTNVLLRLVNSYLVDSPQPANISYLWNFGSLLAFCLVIQILTGCFLAMHYIPNVDLAFNSVEHIMRDVDNGYILRYTHANVASFFFIFVYAHIGRGMWYGSYRAPRILVWSIGVIILVLMMAIGFLGYVYSPKWLNLITNNILTTMLTLMLISTFCLFVFALRGLALVFFRFCLNFCLRSPNPGPMFCKSANTFYLLGYLQNATAWFKAQHTNAIQYNLQPVRSEQRLTFLSLRLQTQLKKGNINSIFPYSLAPIGGSSSLALRKFSSTAFCYEESGSYLSAANVTTQLSSVPAPSEAKTNTQNLNKIISSRLTEFLIENELNPIFSYEDLQLDKVRKKISFETRNLSGVYMVLNKVTLDFYIGSASTGKIYSRFNRHLISFNGSKIVKFAVKKYKLTSFAFLVLELFPEIITKENNNKLITLEDFYLKTMLPNYNILTEAGSSFGYKHTEITRLNMSKNYSQARKEWIKNLNKGKTLSPETIEKIKEKALNRKPLTYSAEAIANMKKKSKPITLYNLDRTVYGNFPSISEAAKTVGCDIKTINRALKTEKKILKKRFIVKIN